MAFGVRELFGNWDLGEFDDLDEATRAAMGTVLEKALLMKSSTQFLITGDDGTVLRVVSITFFPGGK